jgi:hypothetical protein
VSGDSCNVTVDGAQTAAGSYTATASSLSNSNYKLPSANTKSFTINKKKLILTGVTAKTKEYDGSDEAILEGEAALNGIEEGDEVSIGQVSAKYAAGKGVGTEKAVTATATLTGEDAGNYDVTPLTNLTADITKKTVTVNGINEQDDTYRLLENTQFEDLLQHPWYLALHEVMMGRVAGFAAQNGLSVEEALPAALRMEGKSLEDCRQALVDMCLERAKQAALGKAFADEKGVVLTADDTADLVGQYVDYLNEAVYEYFAAQITVERK